MELGIHYSDSEFSTSGYPPWYFVRLVIWDQLVRKDWTDGRLPVSRVPKQKIVPHWVIRLFPLRCRWVLKDLWYILRVNVRKHANGRTFPKQNLRNTCTTVCGHVRNPGYVPDIGPDPLK